ncbi:hypothetical protein [Promicromonospora iranensis]|uniref:Uncharacterized protein n=1 Tax=Promicromonospora iranensis TaxID=1105144 RepID=A0ABU2CQ94_9MICO|nr:hypothetical protein [Promicromonospora iranensis]MDR7383517.1 hypothetical protein [Promicromonospora iranensis]
MARRTEDLAAARRLLLALSEGLAKAGRLLVASGLAEDARAVARMRAEVGGMRKRVRTVHNAAIAAERGTTATEEN